MQPSQTGPRFRPTEARTAHRVSMIMMIVAGCFQYAAGAVQAILLATTDLLGLGLALMGMYLVTGTLFVVSGLLIWHVVAAGYTELTPGALVTRQYRTRVIEWRAITDIQPYLVWNSRFWRVRLRLADGRTVKLIAPLTRGSRPDPRFGAEVEMMRAAWYAATGRGMSRFWPPAG